MLKKATADSDELLTPIARARNEVGTLRRRMTETTQYEIRLRKQIILTIPSSRNQISPFLRKSLIVNKRRRASLSDTLAAWEFEDIQDRNQWECD